MYDDNHVNDFPRGCGCGTVAEMFRKRLIRDWFQCMYYLHLREKLLHTLKESMSRLYVEANPKTIIHVIRHLMRLGFGNGTAQH